MVCVVVWVLGTNVMVIAGVAAVGGLDEGGAQKRVEDVLMTRAA